VLGDYASGFTDGSAEELSLAQVQAQMGIV
jgi:hypothetical protein